MTVTSGLNLGLPAAPLADDPALNGELQIIYNALHLLQQVLNDAGIPSGGVSPSPAIADVPHGGTGVATITGMLYGNGVANITGVASAVVGNVLKVTGANTYAFSAPGYGDVTGPAGAVAGNVAVFSGGTGKVISDGGTLGSAAFTSSAAYQPIDTDLSAIAALISAADKLPYATGAGTWSLTDLTAAGRAILDDADATAQRVTLGLVIGTNVQAYDADLTTWAGITPGANVGTALAIAVGSAGAFVTFNGALGTPSSGTVTNLTGTASININGTVGATTPANGTFLMVTANGPASGTGYSALFSNYTTNDIWIEQSNGTASATSGTMRISKNAGNSRSINATGTLNASGADYAEYEPNGGAIIAKGDIVGFNNDGILTTIFSDSIHFGVKSTNPSYVGGDSWSDGNPVVGIRPEPELILIPEFGLNNENVDVIVELCSKKIQLEKELILWKDRHEAARKLVDRIAYAGKVPVNVYDASVGQYIIAAPNNDGSITGKAIAAPTFEQYLQCVGRVNKVLPDGRAEIVVITH